MVDNRIDMPFGKWFVITFFAILMVLATLAGALALDVTGISKVTFIEDSSEEDMFLISGIQGVTGSNSRIAASLVKTDSAKATRDVIIGSEFSEYYCDYKFLSRTASQGNRIYNYFVPEDRYSWKVLSYDTDFANSVKESLGPNQEFVGLLMVVGHPKYKFASWVPVIREAVYEIGSVSEGSPDFKVMFTVSNVYQTSEGATLTKMPTEVSLNYGGESIARVESFGGGLSTGVGCPRSSNVYGIKNVGSPTGNLVTEKVISVMANQDLTRVSQTLSEWWNSKTLLPSFSDLKARVALFNPTSADLSTVNVLVGASVNPFSVNAEGTGWRVNLIDRKEDFPILPVFNLRIDADFVGVVLLRAEPVISLGKQSLKVVSGTQSQMPVIVTNKGGGDGQVTISGTCQNDLVYVETKVDSFKAGETKTLNINVNSASNQALQTTCSIKAVSRSYTSNQVSFVVDVESGFILVEGTERCRQNPDRVEVAMSNSWTTKQECIIGEVCVEYLTEPKSASCQKSDVDECISHSDCISVLSPKEGYDVYCNEALFQMNTCQYKEKQDFTSLIFMAIGFMVFAMMGGLTVSAVKKENYTMAAIVGAIGLMAAIFSFVSMVSFLGMLLGMLLTIGFFISAILVIAGLMLKGIPFVEDIRGILVFVGIVGLLICIGFALSRFLSILDLLAAMLR